MKTISGPQDRPVCPTCGTSENMIRHLDGKFYCHSTYPIEAEPIHKKPESPADRVDRLEHSLALAHLSIKRLQDHLCCLEHDKTKLVAAVQSLRRRTTVKYLQTSNPPYVLDESKPSYSDVIQCR